MPHSPLTHEQRLKLLSELHQHWRINDEGTRLGREFKTTGFAQAMHIAQMCAGLADAENHHPDIRLGWGYCDVSLTTHSAKSLTSLDFSYALKLDGLLAEN